jgi:hypothetical protein
MKMLCILSLLATLSFPSYSGPDSSNYYAASRLDYYTNEEAGEIMVYVPAKLKEVKITVDLVFEYEFLNRGFQVIAGEVSTVPYSLKILREGENEITVSFYENDKWIDSRKIWVTVRPHNEYSVKIDRSTGGLVTYNLPLFSFGFYTNFPFDPDLPEMEAIKGFNLISPYQRIGRKTLKDRKAYMDRCADLGMKVNYNLCSVAGGGGVGSSSIEGLSSIEKKEMLRKEIETFRDHPALLAWYIADEPDGLSLPADSLRETYRIIKELDPYHPVSLLINSPRQAEEFKDVTDIVMTNPYPIPQGTILEVKEYVEMIRQIFWLEKPIWIVPQAFGGNEWWLREPTIREIRAMTYMSVIYGATGIQYFIRNGRNSFPKSTAMWGECGALALEIAELTPDILSPHPAPKLETETPGIHARAWNRSGLVTIAVLNEKNEPRNFRLQMKDIDITVTAEVIFENRKLNISGGGFEDIIDGYGTRVYRFDVRNKPAAVIAHEKGNLVIDPGFENISDAGVPSACYVYPGEDHGCTYFVDSRRHYEGEHCLRMNNPGEKPGNILSFYGLKLDQGKSYTISIMARTGPSSNVSYGKKKEPVSFKLKLGNTEQTFFCTGSWEKYEITGIEPDSNEQGNRILPQLQLTGKGTAWFDLIQVYPDLDVIK